MCEKHSFKSVKEPQCSMQMEAITVFPSLWVVVFFSFSFQYLDILNLANSFLIVCMYFWPKFDTLGINLLAIVNHVKNAKSKQCSVHWIDIPKERKKKNRKITSMFTLCSIGKAGSYHSKRRTWKCGTFSWTVTKNTVQMDFYLFMIFGIFRDSIRTFVPSFFSSIALYTLFFVLFSFSYSHSLPCVFVSFVCFGIFVFFFRLVFNARSYSFTMWSYPHWLSAV